ncbi:MAG: putative ABC transporter substrate-binding protein yesO [Lachnoclostridium sp.]|jgi:raffinose/stachyose/melibiose transport system substrate-binding protein
MGKGNRKLIALILSLVLCMTLLAGCGKSGQTSSESSDSNAASTDTASDSDAGNDASDSGKEITIKFPCIWVGTDGKAEVFGKMVESFNKENEGKIKVVIEENTDYDAYEDKIRTTISTGDAPDIFTFKSHADLELYSQSGKLMDLTSYLADPSWSNNFVSGVIDAAKVDGKNYAIPYENGVIPIMFNAKLLSDAGITSLPTSYDELWEACEALKAKGVYPITQMTNNNAWTSMLWYSYALASVGGADVYEKGLDDPAFVEAAKILQKMFEYTSPDAVGADATVVNGHFFNERAAIYTNGSWILSRIKSEGVEGLYDSIQISGSLSYNGGESGAYVNAIQAYIAAGKQDDPAKEEAIVKFLKYITDPARVTELSNSSGSIFTVKTDVTEDTDLLQADIIVQSKAAPYMIGTFESVMPTSVTTAFPAALESLVLGEYTPEQFVQALKDAQ